MFMTKGVRRFVSRRCTVPYSSSGGKEIVLGIETSCDDTGAAIIDGCGNILSEKKHSQLQVHLDSGGVIPIVARNLHNEYLDDIVYDTLQSSGVTMNDVTLVAVTNRPGLPLSLKVGVEYAQKLAVKYRKALIPIHHMEAHATTASMFDPRVTFPFLSLLISGGHSQLAFFKNLRQIYLLGEALDDAPGEVMDKIARRLRVKNLGPPFDSLSGGAALEILAKTGDASKSPLTVPLHAVRNCDFSFSAFKALIPILDRMERESRLPVDRPLPQIHDISAALLSSLTLHILERLARAIEFVEGSKMWKDDFDPSADYRINYSEKEEEFHVRVVVSGGVACNDFIINSITDYCAEYEGVYESTSVSVHTPRPKKWCSDNAVMIAWNALLHSRDNSPRILRRQQDMDIAIEAKAGLGVNISSLVSKANIKPRKIKLKS